MMDGIDPGVYGRRNPTLGVLSLTNEHIHYVSRNMVGAVDLCSFDMRTCSLSLTRLFWEVYGVGPLQA